MLNDNDFGLVWFKNDLRLHDNEMLFKAAASKDKIIFLYVIDERLFTKTELGFKKTGQNRYSFLLECLNDLKENLQGLGVSLIVKFGIPEYIIPELVKKYAIKTIYTQEEYAIEEKRVINKLKEVLPNNCKLKMFWGWTLYHKNDIPYKIEDIPLTSKAYRINTTKSTAVRKTFPTPNEFKPLEHDEDSEIPSVEILEFESEITQFINPYCKGGETAALERLQEYTFKSQNLTTYRWTRNSSLGMDYSSKFSPYLALGCFSPRTIYETVKRYEDEIKRNQSTWWLIFELVWRDYFTFKGMRMGTTIYKTAGYSNKTLEFTNNRDYFQRWCQGTTGIPFVDAHMRQLNKTGYMSNRGRVNCSSYLIHDLKIDWTWGASYFENKLIDYDPHVNWMNWHYQAYEIWYTNPINQSIKYKASEYIQKWIPELQHIDSNFIYIPWLLKDISNYPSPIELYPKWDRSINKIIKSENGSLKMKFE